MDLNDLIKILAAIDNDESPLIPYQLHDGLRRIIEIFGSPSKAGAFFIKFQNAEKVIIKAPINTEVKWTDEVER